MIHLSDAQKLSRTRKVSLALFTAALAQNGDGVAAFHDPISDPAYVGVCMVCSLGGIEVGGDDVAHPHPVEDVDDGGHLLDGVVGLTLGPRSSRITRA